MKGLSITACLAGAFAALVAFPGAGQQSPSGETLFTSTYKCYACHGFDAQTGLRRLLPMNYTKEGFVTFVQNSPLPQMPPFADVSDSELGAIYDYIVSIPIDAPEIDDVPILRDIAKRQADALED